MKGSEVGLEKVCWWGAVVEGLRGAGRQERLRSVAGEGVVMTAGTGVGVATTAGRENG